MRHYPILLIAFFFAGCASLMEKLNDPAVVSATANLGNNLQKLGDATGFPYAGAGLATLGMLLYLAFGAKRKVA